MKVEKDSARYPKLLKKIGKEAPKQLYYNEKLEAELELAPEEIQ